MRDLEYVPEVPKVAEPTLGTFKARALNRASRIPIPSTLLTLLR